MALIMGERTSHESEPDDYGRRKGAPSNARQYRDRGSARGCELVEALRPAYPRSDAAQVAVRYEMRDRAGGDARSGEGVVFRGRRVPLQDGAEWRRNDIVAIKVIADDLFRLPGDLPVSQAQLLKHFALMLDQFHLVRALRAPGLVVPHSVFLVDATHPTHEWLYSVYDDDIPLFLGSPLRPVAVVEWVAGVPLTLWNRRSDEIGRLRVMRPVAKAIDAMRLTGASFRDLKPENLVVVGDRAVLVDLGMIVPAELRIMDPRLPGAYVDPDRESYGYTRDLYAFAALLVHQLTVPNIPGDRDHIAFQADQQARTRLAAVGVPGHVADLLAVELHADHAGRGRRGYGAGPALESLLDGVLDGLERPAPRARRGGRR